MGKRALRGPDFNGGNHLLKIFEALKRHPLIAVLGALVAVVAGFATIIDMTERVTPVIENVVAPYRVQKDAVYSLHLEQTVDIVNGKLGKPEESKDLCQVTSICSEDEQGELLLNVYRNELYTVRAVFDENSLNFFAVTLQSEKFAPDIHWLDYNLGSLGKTTYNQAYDSVAVKLEPNALIFIGLQTSAYAEVIAPGAPGQYQGLMLASAPDGLNNLPWDLDGAQSLNTAQIASITGQAPLEAADTFRIGSVPNTFGLFHDDGGRIGNLLHDPQNAITLLFSGTNF